MSTQRQDDIDRLRKLLAEAVRVGDADLAADLMIEIDLLLDEQADEEGDR
jgi:hypothetical protein